MTFHIHIGHAVATQYQNLRFRVICQSLRSLMEGKVANGNGVFPIFHDPRQSGFPD